MAGRSNWTISEDCLQDMNLVFDNTSDLIRGLPTNAGTWYNITEKKGVKKSTARNHVKSFVVILSSVSTNNGDIEGVDRDLAKKLFDEKYKNIYENISSLIDTLVSEISK